MASPAGSLRYADRYRVLRRLGAGGMATVYLAEDERLGRQVAVKRLHADSPEDVARRFDREARLGASLNHPNLVAVYDTLTDPEGVLIVMEYVEGPTLAASLKDGPLPLKRALEVVREVAAALDHAHRHGIIHRDVKPANILLAERGQAKLADLGIAFAAERATHITRTGTVLGTPSYMAPEQLEGRDVGPAVDVYSLATVAFEALSGRKARTGGSPVEIAQRIATQPAPELSEAWPEAPPPAGEVLCQGMAFDLATRPASAGELAARLAAALEGREAATAPTRRAGAPGAAAAGAAAALAAGAAADASRGEGEQPADEQPVGEQPDRPAALEGDPDSGAPRAGEDEAPARRGDAHSPRSAPGRPAPAPRRRARPAWLAPAALLLLVAIVAVVAVLGTGGGGAGSGSSEPSGTGETETGQSGAGSGSSAAEGASQAGLEPAKTATSFYERAAADDFQGAWALAGPGFRSQLGGYESFRGGLSTLESIEFRQAEPIEQSGDSARVAIRTVATHSDGVDRCQGTVSLARGPSGWLVDRADVACPESTRGGAASAPESAGGAATSAQGGGEEASAPSSEEASPDAAGGEEAGSGSDGAAAKERSGRGGNGGKVKGDGG